MQLEGFRYVSVQQIPALPVFGILYPSLWIYRCVSGVAFIVVPNSGTPNDFMHGWLFINKYKYSIKIMIFNIKY